MLSSEWRENMPYSGLESLAAQTPIIGACIGGIPELVEEGRTGFTFESGNVSDLSETLVKASHVSEIDYRDMQQACGKYVSDRCRQDIYMERLNDAIYADLLKGGSMNRGLK